MGELANCAICDGLFVKVSRDICPNCINEEEKAFQTVYDFMKKRVNRQATIAQIVEGTGVSEDLIIKFVKEKRLRASQFPNLSYPCEKCGKGINDGKLCESCSNELAFELKYHEQIDKVAERNKAEQIKANTYYSVNKSNRKY